MTTTAGTRVVAPGSMLLDWLVQHGMTQAGLARELDVSLKHINEFVRGRGGVSALFCERLAYCTGHEPNYWWNLLCEYKWQTRHMNGTAPRRR